MMRPTSAPGRLQLFCFPYAGGGASIFHSWQGEVGPLVRIHPIRLRGRETRIFEPPLRSVPELVENVAAELMPAIEGPFALFGYSFGALLAFEAARYLRRQGLRPERLLVAALKAPHLPLRRKQIRNLSDGEFATEIRNLRGTPEPVLNNAELMQLILPSIKADFTAYETYRYSEDRPLEWPITAMRGATDNSVSPEELGAWREQTSAEFATRVFPGGHFFLHTSRTSLTWTVKQELLQTVCAAA